MSGGTVTVGFSLDQGGSFSVNDTTYVANSNNPIKKWAADSMQRHAKGVAHPHLLWK